jgi:ribonuclease P protein component
MSEEDVSTQHPKALEEARVPASHVDPSRAGHLEGAPPEGPPQAVGLIWRVRDRQTFVSLAARRDSQGAGRPSRVHIGPVTVSFVDGSTAERPRVAYSIGRKVGSAVERNRLRRRLRTIARELAPQLRPGAYLIGVAPQGAQLRFGELRTTVIRAIEAVTRTREPVRPDPKSSRL